jgi:cephalosporin-C deacetylase-like acetyl esterase
MLVFAALFCRFAPAGEEAAKLPVIKVTADRENFLYKSGETVTFTITAENPDAATYPADKITYLLNLCSMNVVEKGELDLTADAKTVSYTFTAPGWMLLQLNTGWKTPDGKPLNFYGGAMCEPEKLMPGMEPPADFAAFWDEKKKTLDAMPFEPELVPVADKTNDKIETYAIVLKTINGAKIRGHFAKPKAEGKYPAMMIVHGAGTYGISPNEACSYATRGAMAIDINAHDIENGQPQEYYDELKNNALKDYPRQGRESREKSYFLRMFASCYRAGQYITSRPDWDGKHFVVWGSSQGGGQAIVTASLCPNVTAFVANVPALCDHGAREVGRKPGWPTWVAYDKDGKADPAMLEASRYFDCTNFARTIKAKALISNGFIDTTCAPVSVYAVYNVLPGEKQMFDMVTTGHGISPEFSKLRNDFVARELGLQ